MNFASQRALQHLPANAWSTDPFHIGSRPWIRSETKIYGRQVLQSERAALGEEGSSAAQQVRNSTPSPTAASSTQAMASPQPRSTLTFAWDPHAHYDRGATVDKITAPEVPAARTRTSVAGLLLGCCVLCKCVDSEFEYACDQATATLKPLRVDGYLKSRSVSRSEILR